MAGRISSNVEKSVRTVGAIHIFPRADPKKMVGAFVGKNLFLFLHSLLTAYTFTNYCPDGEIGRHASLRGWCSQGCASSSLVLGTRKKDVLFGASFFLDDILSEEECNEGCHPLYECNEIGFHP